MKWVALLVLAFAAALAHAQPGPRIAGPPYDVACPAGSTVLRQSTVPQTGHNRAIECIDSFGVVTYVATMGSSTSAAVNISAFAGADWCVKVNAADAFLGASGGELWLSNAAAPTGVCSVNITLNQDHVLRDTSCSTYALQTRSILVTGENSTGSAVIGCGKNLTNFTITGNQSVIKPANSLAHLTRNVHLEGFTIASGAGSTGIGIDELNAYKWLVQDVRVAGFDGAGGACIRIRGQGIAGPYFDRHYHDFTENCETHVLINYDVIANTPTSFIFDDFHANVGTGIYDIDGSSGWFSKNYLQNASGIAVRCRAGCDNNFFDAVNIDNSGTPGVGTGLQFDAGANDNRFAGIIGNFAVNTPVDNGINNDFTSYNTAQWRISSTGGVFAANNADSDWLGVVRAGLTADKNAGWLYENHNGTQYWWSGITDTNTWAVRQTSTSGNKAIEVDASGNTTITPANGLDNTLNLNMQAGSSGDRQENINFLDKVAAVSFAIRRDAANTFLEILDSTPVTRLVINNGANKYSSLSGASTAATLLSFFGSGGTQFGNGDGSTVITQIDSSGNATFGVNAAAAAAVANSPYISLQGIYQNTAGPTYAVDQWQLKNVLGAGTNGSTTLTFSHSGTTSAIMGLQIPQTANFSWSGRGGVTATADGILKLFNNAANDFGRLTFGGTTNSFPSLKRSSTALIVRLADDSADAPITASSITISGAGATGKAACIKADKSIGYCSTVVDAAGACTCN